MNVSKKRFPFRPATKQNVREYTDSYFIYSLNKRELGKWLNIWFPGTTLYSKDNNLYREEMWTVREVDEETSRHLYGRKFNPISLNTLSSTRNKFPKNDKGQVLYDFKAQIHSLDDSSYGMWWKDVTLDQIKELRLALMRYIESVKLVNGHAWFEKGKELGAWDFDTN